MIASHKLHLAGTETQRAEVTLAHALRKSRGMRRREVMERIKRKTSEDTVKDQRCAFSFLQIELQFNKGRLLGTKTLR